MNRRVLLCCILAVTGCSASATSSGSSSGTSTAATSGTGGTSGGSSSTSSASSTGSGSTGASSSSGGSTTGGSTSSSSTGSTGNGCAAPAATSTVTQDPALELQVQNDAGAAVIADPSLFYPPGAPGGALAYSAVPRVNGAWDQGAIETRVAVSNDLGASWAFVARANTAVSDTPPAGSCPSGSTCTATIVNETPTIVFDPTDVTARQWKLFTHRYYVVKASGHPNPILLYTVGNISMYTAPVPAGPWSGPTVAAGWPGSTFSSSGAAFLSTDSTETSSCVAFGEPGATLAPDGSLHLALSCIQAPLSNPEIDIVLLRSVDHGASWSVVGRPLLGSDGACFGGNGKRVNAVDLFTHAGSEYLMATPEQATGREGCVVFALDVAADGGASLERSDAGEPIATRQLVPQFLPNNLVHYAGACTFSEGATATGYTMSFLDVPADGGGPTVQALATGLGGP